MICIAKRLGPIATIMTTAFVLAWSPVRADVILDWNAIMQSTVSGQAPFPQARFAAITQLAVFEAVNAIKKEHQPYLGTITAPAEASAEAAAVAAAHAVLKNYFPASAAALAAARAMSLATIPTVPARAPASASASPLPRRYWRHAMTMVRRPRQFYAPAGQNPGDLGADAELHRGRRRLLPLAQTQNVCASKRRPVPGRTSRLP